MSARELLAKLVRCPSVNPGDRTSVEPPYGEAAMVALLSEFLRALGGDVTIYEVHPGRPNLCARFTGRDTSRTVLLDAHTDTVSHLNMIIDSFAAEVRDERLYGRGACDTKGPMTAMLLALESVQEEGGLACNVIFAATCDEEHGATGAMHLAESGLKADFAIIAEPTELKVVVRHKGVSRARVTLHGKAVHSSVLEHGRNAIYAGARVVSRLEAMAEELSLRPLDAELGSPTLSVGTIDGGTAINIVPDLCTIQIDRRLLPTENGDAVKAAIESAVREAVKEAPGADPEIEWAQFYPPMETAADTPGLAELDAALTSVTGAAEHGVVAYGTNGGFYAQAGIPGVVFGPGSVTDAHTNNESIALDQVETAARVLRRFLSDY